MRERGCCGERKEMRNREDTRERERERERERVSYVNKKVLFCLELCYSTILKIELHCSTIAKKFAIVGISIL